MKCSKYDTDTAIPKDSTVAEKLTLMGFHLQNMRFHREKDPTRHGQLAEVSKVIPKVKEMKEEEVPPVEWAQAPSTEGDIKQKLLQDINSTSHHGVQQVSVAEHHELALQVQQVCVAEHCDREADLPVSRGHRPRPQAKPLYQGQG